MPTLAQYIWIDGSEPTPQLRGKTKVLKDADLGPSTNYDNVDDIPLDAFPVWGADGSSTNQASGDDSDIILKPVRAVRDPFRDGGYIVLCEAFDGEEKPLESNARARLRQLLDEGAAEAEAWFGFEQEYTLLQDRVRPLGFPKDGFPGPQGPYYCAVGTANVVGRDFYEDFIQATIDAGVPVTGYNWEVMPGQAEVQVFGDALAGPDHLWITRWLLHRTSEHHDVRVSLDPKPAEGDWNGAGMHTNFSTRAMREDGGLAVIEKACAQIGERIEEHLAAYGAGYERRLTGDHETASYKEFSFGVADRTASIRIPRQVAQDGKGYLEDRRPNANACPYEIAYQMIRTTKDL